MTRRGGTGGGEAGDAVKITRKVKETERTMSLPDDCGGNIKNEFVLVTRPKAQDSPDF